MKVCFSSEFVVTQVSFEWVSSQEIVKSTQLYHLSSTQSCYALKWLVSPCHQSGLGRWGKKEKWPREPELNSRKKPACWVRWPVYTMLFACEANLFTLFSNVTQKFYVKYNYMREKIRQKWLLPEYWSHACCKIEDVKLNSLTSKFCLTVYWKLFFLYFGEKKEWISEERDEKQHSITGMA